MKRCVLILCNLLLVYFSLYSEEKVVVDIRGDIKEENIKKVFASKIVSAIIKSNRYTAVERNEAFRNSIEDEFILQSSGDVRKDQIFKIRQQFGAKYIAAVELTELLGEIYINSHLIDAETAKVIYAYDISGVINNMQRLETLASKIANGLIIEPLQKERERAEATARELRAKEARLRDKAIENLIPVGTKVIGKYLIKLIYKVDVEWKFQRPLLPDDLYININYQGGYLLADAEIYEYLYKHGLRIESTEKIRVFITSTELKREYKNGFLDYDIPAVYFDEHLYVPDHDITLMSQYPYYEKKKKNYNYSVVIPPTDTWLSAILYKAAPTESQIQDEIRRLRNAGY